MLHRKICKRSRCFLGTLATYFTVFVLMFYWWKSRDKMVLTAYISGKSSVIGVVNTERRVESGHDRYVHLSLEDKTRQLLSKQFQPETRLCKDRFVGYANLFGIFTNVIINPSLGHGRRGGENISDVLNQAEGDEYYFLDRGYFNVRCPDNSSFHYQFSHESGHLNKWIEAVAPRPRGFEPRHTIRGWTIAVQRYEYANLYHTMTDYYNAFLLASYFNMTPSEINILWIDGHPRGALDETWRILFGKTKRAGDLTEVVMFERLAWNILGYDSMLNNHGLPFVPSLEEFRSFFLANFGVQDTHSLNCDNLKVLFLWRRDYLAHPRNPSGQVSRKVQNEDELMEKAKEILPGHTIDGVQIDKFDMKKQLEIISGTDILIGMHGAGLTHTLFLPKTSGLIELFPTYWTPANRHFRAMAQWRHLHYQTWQNTDPDRELPNKYTVVDPVVLKNMVHEMHHNICGDKVRH